MPTFSDDLVRFVTHASLTQGEEEAQFQITCWRHHETGNIVDWPADTQFMCEGFADRFTTAFPVIDQLFTTDVLFDYVKATHIDTAGLALDQAQVALGVGGVGLPGTSGSDSLPYEVAMAVSLYAYTPGTFVTNRARKRGRFYLPPMHTAIMSSDGRVSGGTPTTIQTWADAFLEDVQGMPAHDQPVGAVDHMDVVIASGVAGENFQVQFSRTGNVPDVQRRRRRSQIEVYTTSALANH